MHCHHHNALSSFRCKSFNSVRPPRYAALTICAKTHPNRKANLERRRARREWEKKRKAEEEWKKRNLTDEVVFVEREGGVVAEQRRTQEEIAELRRSRKAARALEAMEAGVEDLVSMSSKVPWASRLSSQRSLPNSRTPSTPTQAGSLGRSRPIPPSGAPFSPQRAPSSYGSDNGSSGRRQGSRDLAFVGRISQPPLQYSVLPSRQARPPRTGIAEAVTNTRNQWLPSAARHASTSARADLYDAESGKEASGSSFRVREAAFTKSVPYGRQRIQTSHRSDLFSERPYASESELQGFATPSRARDRDSFGDASSRQGPSELNRTPSSASALYTTRSQTDNTTYPSVTSNGEFFNTSLYGSQPSEANPASLSASSSYTTRSKIQSPRNPSLGRDVNLRDDTSYRGQPSEPNRTPASPSTSYTRSPNQGPIFQSPTRDTPMPSNGSSRRQLSEPNCTTSALDASIVTQSQSHSPIPPSLTRKAALPNSTSSEQAPSATLLYSQRSQPKIYSQRSGLQDPIIPTLAAGADRAESRYVMRLHSPNGVSQANASSMSASSQIALTSDRHQDSANPAMSSATPVPRRQDAYRERNVGPRQKGPCRVTASESDLGSFDDFTVMADD